MVAVLRWAGVNDNGGAGVSAAIEKSSASNGIAVSSAAARCANTSRSLAMRAPGELAGTNAAVRAMCWITG